MNKSSGNLLRDLLVESNNYSSSAKALVPDEIVAKLQEEHAEKESILVRLIDLESSLTKKEEELKLYRRDLSRLSENKKELTRALEQKEVEVQNERTSLQFAFAEREKSFREEIEIQRAALKSREESFFVQRKALEEQTRSLESEHSKLKEQLTQRAVEHDKALADLFRQKEHYEAEFQERMEAKAAVFVDNALGSLRSNQRRFEAIGSAWSVAGLLAVVCGAVLAFNLAQEGTVNIVMNKDITWPLIAFFTAKGAVLLGLIIAIVQLSSRMTRNYMHESVKNGERRHAINYGKFYLSVYGAGTDGDKLKEVFSQWNIVGDSAFSEKDDQASPLSKLDLTETAKALIVGVQTAMESEKK